MPRSFAATAFLVIGALFLGAGVIQRNTVYLGVGGTFFALGAAFKVMRQS